MELSIQKSHNRQGRVKLFGSCMNALGMKKHTQVRIRTKGMKRWLCSCENFLFEKSGKRRHCKHLHAAKLKVMKQFHMKSASL